MIDGDLLLVGASHRTAGIAERERLAAVVGALDTDFAERALLSTCNRVELYLAGGTARGDLAERLAHAAGVPGSTLVVAEGAAVVRHLCRVAAGLDSTIVGEQQILTQVRRSALSASGPRLARLFAAAVHAGKRVRRETGLAARPDALAAAAARLAHEQLDGLDGRRAIVLGAGVLGSCAAATLTRAGCEVLVARRATLVRTLAELGSADLVVSCTRSAGLVVVAADVAPRRRPLVLVDLAVPRDIDPAIAAVPGCRLYDLDEVTPLAATCCTRADLEAAEAIAAEEASRYAHWLAARAAAPSIAAFRRNAETIRAAELRRAHALLDELTPTQRRAVEAVTAQLVNKLLHAPTVRIKEPSGSAYLPALRHLFALEEAA